jgi:hypothetical protein
MRSTCLLGGAALAALAGFAAEAPAQPRAPASAAARAPAPCPVPRGWSAARFGGADDPYDGNVVVNGIAVLPGEAQRWNGAPIEREMLARFLEISGLMSPTPVLLLWPDEGARCRELAAAAAFVASRFACSPQRCRLAGVRPPRHDPPPAPPAPPPPRPARKG